MNRRLGAGLARDTRVRRWLAGAAGMLAAFASFGRFEEVRREVGLDGLNAARVVCADLDRDGRPDLIVRPNAPGEVMPRVFLWRADPAALLSGRFVEQAAHGLPAVRNGDLVTLADLDNDGRTDAVVTRYLDYRQPAFVPPADPPDRSAWLPGRGDGTFGAPRVFDESLRGTTAAVTVGDANRDGRPDVWLGQWYERYFTGYEAFANDLLLQHPGPDGAPRFARWSPPGENLALQPETDGGGRPTYGLVIATLDDGALPHLWELNYGRRWDRLYRLGRPAPLSSVPPPGAPPPPHLAPVPGFEREDVLRDLVAEDVAPAAGVDGDAIRHGRHPAWLAERGRTDPRFDRSDEPPFRANGNSFDGAVGDIDNDGDFDLFVSTIIHAWAGDSSDRSRFLVNQLRETGRLRFESFEALSVDRWAPLPPPGQPLEDIHRRQNQGDIFAELADLDHDGRLDLVICSSDYPDPPPWDERLRVFLQQPDGRFRDATTELGLDHFGAGQPALLDLDRDGALDLVVGQTFNKSNVERRRAAGLANGTLRPGAEGDAGAEPRLHVYRNALAAGRASLVLELRGDPARGVARDAWGAIVRVWADLDGDPATPPVRQLRQLLGPGGHAGKRHEAIVHVGLGRATRAERVEIVWPDRDGTTTVATDLPAGRHVIALAEAAMPADHSSATPPSP